MLRVLTHIVTIQLFRQNPTMMGFLKPTHIGFLPLTGTSQITMAEYSDSNGSGVGSDREPFLNDYDDKTSHFVQSKSRRSHPSYLTRWMVISNAVVLLLSFILLIISGTLYQQSRQPRGRNALLKATSQPCNYL